MGIPLDKLTDRQRAMIQPNPWTAPKPCEPDAPNQANCQAATNPSQVSDWAEEETPLQNAILKLLKERGWVVLSGSTARRTGRTVGEPDLICFGHGGRLCLIELKSAKGKLRPEQEELHERLAVLGHVVHVVRSIREFEEITR